MPVKKEVSIDEVLGTRKDISDDDGVLYKAHIAPRSWNEGERSAVFVMSAETEDSYRDIVVQAGIDTKSRFEANPVALFGHKSWGTPIGHWENVRRINGSPKRTEGKLLFTPEGVDEDADKVARHVAGGTLRASSIGFMAKAAERILDTNGEWNYGYKYLETELYECSVVTIPAVREALIKGAGAKARDIVSPEVIEEFLEHLKANPAIAKMIDRSLYEEVYREITGNKTVSAGEFEVKLTALVERMEKAAAPAVVVIGGDASPEIIQQLKAEAVGRGRFVSIAEPVDEIAKELELNVEGFLKDIAPKVDEIVEPERKGTLTKLMDGIRSLFKAEETTPPAAPEKADPAIQKALREQADEITAKYAA